LIGLNCIYIEEYGYTKLFASNLHQVAVVLEPLGEKKGGWVGVKGVLGARVSVRMIVKYAIINQ